VHRYQAYLFFPMLLEASARWPDGRPGTGSWRRHCSRSTSRGYLAVVLLVLSPVRAVVFILAQQSLFGLYVGSSFAPNHKGMLVLQAGDRTDFLRRQVLTSRNVHGGWLTDLALGGLNYQIEHHLLPSMPRPNLRRSQIIVKQFCHQRGLPYCQSSLIGSYTQALCFLNTVGGLGRDLSHQRRSRGLVDRFRRPGSIPPTLIAKAFRRASSASPQGLSPCRRPLTQGRGDKTSTPARRPAEPPRHSTRKRVASSVVTPPRACTRE
jgi:Fatty acid desaturase